MKSIKRIFFCFFIFYVHIISPEVLEGTLVTTPYGVVPVEELSVCDTLIGYEKNNILTPVSIIAISSAAACEIIIIQTDSGEIRTTTEQLFWNDNTMSWIRACEITQNMCFFDINFQKHCCVSLNHISGIFAKTYNITTTYPHNFFITEQKILVHNFLPFLGLGISAIFGGGLEFGGVNAIFSIAGIVLSTQLFKKRSKEKGSFSITPLNDNKGGGSHKKPDDEEGSKNNEWKINTVAKTTFFKKMKNHYAYWKDNTYRRKSNASGLDKKVEYIKWDHIHGDVEAYDKGGKHLGSYDPKTLQKYKPANPRNYIDIR